MAQTFVYVGNAETQTVSVFRLMDDGDLTPVETKQIPGPEKRGMSTPMAISPDKRFLFVGLRNEPFSVVTFHIDRSNGTLTFVGSGPLADQMCYLSTDKNGRFLFAASYQGSKVAVAPIAEGGIVGAAHQVIATKPNAHCIVPTKSGRYVLHTSLGGDVVFQQKFDAAKGELSPNKPYEKSVRAKGGPRHIVLSADETRAYLMNELDGLVYVFPFDAEKGLLGDELQTISAVPKDFTGEIAGADIHLTPNGKFLYASERGSNTLAAFRVVADGRLEAVGNYPTEMTPRGFGIDPSGRYLYATGQKSHGMTSYAIDQSSGALTVRQKHPVGKNPNWVEFVTLP